MKAGVLMKVSSVASNLIEYESVDDMNKSSMIKVNLMKIQKDIDFFNSQQHQKDVIERCLYFKRNKKDFSVVCCNIMHSLCEKQFFFENGDFIIKKNKYLNIIANLLKNFRNSKKITQKQADIIDNYKELKNVIVRLIFHFDIIKESDGVLSANIPKMTEHLLLVETKGKDMQVLYREALEIFFGKPHYF